MPKCLDCGNERSFCSSRIEPVAPTANGPISALVAEFDEDNYIDQMESLADIEVAQEAWERPREYFDRCFVCGSERIVWE